MLNFNQATQVLDDYQYHRKIIKIETLDANNFVLAQDIISPINVPSFAKSAMDGYAIASAELKVNNSFIISDTIYAGDTHKHQLKPNCAMRIMTGAPIPNGCDQVIVKELANESEDNLHVSFNLPATKLNANICQIGEDVHQGALVFSAGEQLTATKIAVLISIGIFQVSVYAKPKVLLITTGDEVVNNQQPLAYGQIYNSNLAYLQTRLKQYGCTFSSTHLNDDEAKLLQLLDNCKSYDLIVTTGAISVGDKDIFRKFITAQKIVPLIDRVNIMPGSPFAFWQYKQLPIISLAGSPYANFVTFELLASRFFANFANDKRILAQKQLLPFKGTYHKHIKRMRFLKARNINNEISLPAGKQLASALFEMTSCNCLVQVERGEVRIKQGQLVTVYKLGGFYE